MRTTPPIYKYTGLIAGLGLAALLVGFVLLLAAESLKLASWIILALGILLLSLAIVIDFQQVRGAVTGKRGIFSTGSTVMVFVFIGIIVLINAISIQYGKRYDITELSQFTLTTQTKDVLTEVTMPIEVVCFFTPTDIYGLGLPAYAQSLLTEYQNFTDLLTIKIIDPDKYPDEAREYGLTEYTPYQSIVFVSEIGRRMVTPNEMVITTSDGDIAGIEMENPFTSAILEVTGVVQKKVYFLIGHDEASIIAGGKFAYAAQALRDSLYKVDTLDLMIAEEVPDDCEVLVIADPKTSLNALEYSLLTQYLENNGALVILINPGSPNDIKEFLSEWWMDVEDGTIIENSAYYITKNNPIVPRTQNIFGLTQTYYPGAASIILREDCPANILLSPLFYTSDATWVEKDFDSAVTPEFNADSETLGTRNIGTIMIVQPNEEYLAEDGSIIPGVKYPQMIVVGDSDFASNEHIYNVENGNQFIYFFEYLTADEQLVKIERKVLPYRSLILTPDEETFIRLASIGLLPLLVLIGGGIIWWRRR